MFEDIEIRVGSESRRVSSRMSLIYYNVEVKHGNIHVRSEQFTGLEWKHSPERGFTTSASEILLDSDGDIHCIWWRERDDDDIAYITSGCGNEQDIGVGWIKSERTPTQMLRLQNTTFAVTSLFYGVDYILVDIKKPQLQREFAKRNKPWNGDYSGNQICTKALDVGVDYAAFAWTGKDMVITSPDLDVPLHLYKSTCVHGDAHWQNVTSGVIDGQIYSASDYVSGLDLSVRDIRCSEPLLLNSQRIRRCGLRFVISASGVVYYTQAENILVTDVRYPTVQYRIPSPNEGIGRYKQGFVVI